MNSMVGAIAITMPEPVRVTVLVCAALVGTAGFSAGALRWLRIAQREHYLPGSTVRFAYRWWTCRWENGALFVLGVAAAASGTAFGVGLAGVVTLIGPAGLGVKGRTSALTWTRRLDTVAVVAAVLVIGMCAAAVASAGHGWEDAGRYFAVPSCVEGGVVLGAPLIVDASLALTGPFERLRARRFVRDAAAKLDRVRPTVVAITGSFGKTSTKNYVAHILGSRFHVVASPASFNNTAGLSRAVNENLALGTEVFIAEMGTYGQGEIASICAWIRPDVAVITSIGPVHLERMKSEEAILSAKAEICEEAATVVLNADDERLAVLGEELRGRGRKVVDARAGDPLVLGAGAASGVMTSGSVSASNVACAVAVARALGMDDEEIAARIPTLPEIPNRRSTYVAQGGFTVIDDTYNANPAGAAAAIAMLAAPDSAGTIRRFVVTPGMVELGARQAPENQTLGEAAAGAADVVVLVGRTNRKWLARGAETGGAEVVRVDTRQDAVEWVARTAGPGDRVLYENDLPDHYP